MTYADFSTVLPEFSLLVFAMLALLGGVWTGKDARAGLILWLSVAVLIVAAAVIGLGGGPARSAFGGMFIDDAFARFAKVLALLAAASVLAMSDRLSGCGRGLMRFEYPILGDPRPWSA